MALLCYAFEIEMFLRDGHFQSIDSPLVLNGIRDPLSYTLKIEGSNGENVMRLMSKRATWLLKVGFCAIRISKVLFFTFKIANAIL